MSRFLWSRRGGLRGLLALGVATTLAACQSLPPAPEAPLRHTGRLSVQVEGDASRSFSAGFELRGTASAGSLALVSPLGTMVGRAQWGAAGVSLVSPDGRSDYASLDAMTQDLMGERVPLLALLDWLDLAAGRPAAAATAQPSVPPGWRLEPIEPGSLRVSAQREQPAPRLRLRVVLDPSGG